MSTKPGRNDPCSCGSGKKYKNCCLGKPQHSPLGPSSFEYEQLVALSNTGQFVELESRACSLLERYPDAGPVWKLLGESRYMQGKDSYQALLTATKLLPGDADALTNLGIVQMGLDRASEALVSCRRAAEIKPDYARAHNNLGLALLDLNRLEEAAASFNRALEINPNDAKAHNNLGLALLDLDRLEDAATSFYHALEIKPDYARAHNNLGLALLGLNRHADAAASFNRALEINPNDAKAHNNLGLALLGLDRYADAAASFNRALEINPEDATACKNLGNALRRIGRLEEALVCYRQLARLNPEDKEAQHHIASLTGSDTERAPAQYVESLFDFHADKFDDQLVHVLKYDVPEKLAALVARHATTTADKWNILDLGCGTGLVGSEIARYARQLVGVDISAKMLEKARLRNLYQRLEHSDLVTMMRGETGSGYDVIVAADVFVYIGRIDEIASEIKRLLCPGGIAAFSFEALDALSREETDRNSRQEYRLENSGRYSHSAGYITRLAATHGFLQQEMVITKIRTEGGKPVNGYLVVWKN